MATEFVCKVGWDGPPSRDYKTLSDWDAVCRCDLTASATRVYATSYHSGNQYDVQDNKQVYLYRGGSRLGTRAWLLHATATQTLVRSIQGPDTPQVGDQWRQTGGNTYGWVTLQDAGDSAIAVAECYNDQVMLDFVSLDRWTTSPINKIKIYTPTSERHSGRAGTGFVIAKYTIDTLIQVNNVDIHIQGIEFVGGGNHIGGTYDSGPHTIEIEACIFHDNNWGHAINTPIQEDLTVKIWNCFLYKTYAAAISAGHRNSDVYVENCSIFKPGSVGVVRAQCYNVVTHKGLGTPRRPADPGNFPGFGDDCTGDYNCDGSEIEDDGSAPGANSLHNQDLKAISWMRTNGNQVLSDQPGEDNIDLHVYYASVLAGAGTDRSAGDIGFNDDIDGDTRVVPWTIGGDQTTYSSSSSSTSSGSASSSSSSASSRFYLYIRDYVVD